MTTTFERNASPATIAFNGSHGTLIVDASTGAVLAYEREGDDEPGYSDLVRVDLDERRAWYAAQGVELPEIQPDGDILDATCETVDGEVIAAENDWRGEIMLAVYGRAPA